jgi:hypothetical protein
MNYESFKIVKLSVCDCIFGVPVAWKHPAHKRLEIYKKNLLIDISEVLGVCLCVCYSLVLATEVKLDYCFTQSSA